MAHIGQKLAFFLAGTLTFSLLYKRVNCQKEQYVDHATSQQNQIGQGIVNILVKVRGTFKPGGPGSSRQLDGDDHSMGVIKWLSSRRRIVSTQGGVINQRFRHLVFGVIQLKVQGYLFIAQHVPH